MPSALFPPPDPPQNHAKAPPEGCSLGHRTVVICGCCRGLFWKRPSPYCWCFADLGRGLDANWLAQRVVFTKTQSGKQIFFFTGGARNLFFAEQLTD